MASLPLSLCVALLLTGGEMGAAPSTGGEFSLVGGVVSGGGTTAGASFTLEGAAGLANAGESTGGEFVLTGGLIGVYAVPGDVELELTRTEDGVVHLTWPNSAAGYVLEFTLQLGERAQWTPVTPAPTGNTVNVPFGQPARFYRLRKP